MARDMTFNLSLGATLASGFRGTFGSVRSEIAGLAKNVRAMEKSSTGQLGERLTESRSKIKGFGADLKAAKTHLEGLRTQLVASGGASGILARQMAQAERKIESLKGNIKRSAETHKELIATIRTESGGVRQLQSAYGQLGIQMEKTRARQQSLSANLAARDANRARMAGLSSGMLGTVMVAASAAAPVKMAMEFESGMADAAKTIEGMRDEAGNLTPKYQAMVREALLLGREMPLAHSELASMMASAGQQGLSDTKEIAAYTKDAAMMAVAFGLSNQDAAEAIGGYRTALGLSQDQVRDMLDLMNYFANTSSASEEGIADIVRRVGGLGGVAGVSHKPMTALAATLDSMKIAPEAAATGIQNLMLALVAGESATKRQDAVLNKLGLDSVELAKRMKTDATGAILDFLRAIKELPEHEQAAALKNYFGKESIKSIAPLLTQIDLLEANFQRVGDQSAYAGSMFKEFSSRASTTAGAAQRAKNKAAELAITIGNALLPSVESGLSAFGNMASGLADLAGRYPLVTKAVGLAAGYIIENWASVGPWFANLWTGITGMAAQVWGFLKEYLWEKNPLMIVPRLIVEKWDGIMASLQPVFDWLKDKFSWVADSFSGLQSAWNFFFGDDEKAVTIAGTSADAVQNMESETLAAGPAPAGVAVTPALVAPAARPDEAMSIGASAGQTTVPETAVVPSFQYQPVTQTSAHPPAELASLMNPGPGQDSALLSGEAELMSLANGDSAAMTPDLAVINDELAGLDGELALMNGEVAALGGDVAAMGGDFDRMLAGLDQEALLANGDMAGLNGDMSLAGEGFGAMLESVTRMGEWFGAMLTSVTQMSEGFSSMAAAFPLQSPTANADLAALPGASPAAPEITNETNIALDLKFEVKGLDEGEFRKKIEGYRADFEGIVRRVVGQMEQARARVNFAR